MVDFESVLDTPIGQNASHRGVLDIRDIVDEKFTTFCEPSFASVAFGTQRSASDGSSEIILIQAATDG